MKKIHAVLVLFVSLTFLPVPSPADPPPWAPAHGWRKKNDPNYVGYTGKKWERDYGVLEGTCNTAAVGAVLGGAVGGAVGSEVGKGANRPVAIVVGTVLGAVIGAKIGAQIDNGDRGCFGHALELGAEQKTVVWSNAATGVSYRLTPTRNFGDQRNPCREFNAVATAGGGDKHEGKGKGKGKGKGNKHAGEGETAIKGVACRQGNGEWVIKT
jgi:surface antigen